MSQENIELYRCLPGSQAEVYEVRDLGDRTFTRGRIRGQGAGSGASIERAMWLAAEWRDKKAVWWCAFESEAEALVSRRGFGLGDVGGKRGGRACRLRGVTARS